MRKLSLPLLIALIALFAFAAPAQAISLPVVGAIASDAPDEEADEDETDAETDAEEAEMEAEECDLEAEDCWETDFEEAEECILEDATASVAAKPGNNTVRLTVRYTAYAPAAVLVRAKLHGSKGKLNLGASHARFRRAGTFHDSFELSEKRMEKALAAREFAIDVHALNTPDHCRLRLSAERGDTRKLRWS